jgi:hypothetical protein
LGREYGTWEKDGTEFGKHNTVYLATLQEIRMGYACFGVRINQIKSNAAAVVDVDVVPHSVHSVNERIRQ